MRRDELILKACSRRLEKKRCWAWIPGVLGGYRRRTPEWAKADDLRRSFEALGDLVRRGRIVWGCVVQANTELFKPGPTIWPGEVVFSVGDKQDMDFLKKLGKALFFFARNAAC